ncbi:protein nipsnap-like [Plakobranchus ocellatus]|uniref:Protein nipsnap-like n=1 Tax=Plakobranchus ocellatus TaxID=259542 RepID=A0AAV4DQF4_9GAST|nr:protein nipsnap-like [Plakobranchus ocellatus]
MAAVCRMVLGPAARPAASGATRSLQPIISSRIGFRNVHSTPALLRESHSDDEAPKGWFSRLRKAAQPEQSHSMALSTKETVFEIQFHSVKPECMEQYLGLYSKIQDAMQQKGTEAVLAASFTVEIGEQDEAIHIWEYPGGYPTLNHANTIYRTDQDFLDLRKHRNTLLRSRRNQILLAFSFWPHIAPRDGSNIYELRSYTLKPGTMYEWANCWAKGIKHRQTNNEPVAGFFTQIGNVYMVEHMWAYKDLQTRKETREAAWHRPGWDECVSYTVPLIRYMQSRILIPTPFSPLQ